MPGGLAGHSPAGDLRHPLPGSLNALNFLAHGMQKRLGPIPVLDLSRLLRSFPSIYELLPIYPVLGTGQSRPHSPGQTRRPRA